MSTNPSVGHVVFVSAQVLALIGKGGSSLWASFAQYRRRIGGASSGHTRFLAQKRKTGYHKSIAGQRKWSTPRSMDKETGRGSRRRSSSSRRTGCGGCQRGFAAVGSRPGEFFLLQGGCYAGVVVGFFRGGGTALTGHVGFRWLSLGNTLLVVAARESLCEESSLDDAAH